MQHRKPRLLTVLVAATAFAVAGSAAVIVRAQEHDEQRPRATTRPAGREGAQTLEHEMGAIGRAFKALQKQVKDPAQNASSLQLVQQFQVHAATAKGMLPDKIAKAPESDRPKLIADYRKMMNSLLRDSLDLEDQLMDNQNDKAAKTLDGMNELQTEGHKEFRPQRKRG